MRNELSLRSEIDINDYLDKIDSVMDSCIKKGLQSKGVLPGPLKIQKQA